MDLIGRVFTLLIYLIISIFVISLTPPIFPKVIEKSFKSKNGEITAKIKNKQRVYSWVGEETSVLLEVEGSPAKREFQIDHNGRMGDEAKFFLFLSKDQAWVRVCQNLNNPLKGVLTWVPNVDNSIGRDEKWARGRWEVLSQAGDQGREYFFECVAFINFKTGELIRNVFPASTREQRESKLFYPRLKDDLFDKIEGEEIFWEPMQSIHEPTN